MTKMANRVLVCTVFFACASSCGEETTGRRTDSPQHAQELNLTPAERGRALFRQCALCHTVKAESPSRIGPNLFGIYGREAGRADDFVYSTALRDSTIIWDDASLNAFLESPQDFLRGNRMAFAGVANPDDRADIIAYLSTLTPQP